MDNIARGADRSSFLQLLWTEEGPMNIDARGAGRIAGLSCAVATAFLLSACQQNPGSGSGQSFSYQEKTAFAEQSGWDKRHCCRRGGRNGGGGLK
jgi:hypothetical protein